MKRPAGRGAKGGGVRVYSAGEDACVGVRVTPSAPRTRLKGLHGDRLKVAVAAPPEDNRANRELEAALAGWLGLTRDRVQVVRGHASRDKVVAFKKVDVAHLDVAIDEALQGAADQKGR